LLALSRQGDLRLGERKLQLERPVVLGREDRGCPRLRDVVTDDYELAYRDRAGERKRRRREAAGLERLAPSRIDLSLVRVDRSAATSTSVIVSPSKTRLPSRL
jgi:hypothetical protein